MNKTFLLLVISVGVKVSLSSAITVDGRPSCVLQDCLSDNKRDSVTKVDDLKEVTVSSSSLYGERAYYTTAEGAGLGPGSVAPGTVTLALLTLGTIEPGFFTNTAAIEPRGTACVGDPAPHGSVLPYNYEVTDYVVIDGNHMRFTFTKAHPAGSTIAIAPECSALVPERAS